MYNKALTILIHEYYSDKSKRDEYFELNSNLLISGPFPANSIGDKLQKAILSSKKSMDICEKESLGYIPSGFSGIFALYVAHISYEILESGKSIFSSVLSPISSESFLFGAIHDFLYLFTGKDN